MRLRIVPRLHSSWPLRGRPAWAGSCCSALDVGGDFYEVLPLSGNSLLVVIADVMGKGVPAALFADTLRTLMRALAEPGLVPGQLLGHLNRLLFEELSHAESFITVQVAVVDPDRRQLQVASAGHCPLLVCNEHGQIRSVSPNGMPLGIQADAAFRTESTLLPVSGLVLLYTDGLTETRDAQGRFFGQERLEHWLAWAVRERRPVAELKAALLRELSDFQGSVPRADDQTFLILAEQEACALSLVNDRDGRPAFSSYPATLLARGARRLARSFRPT